MTNLYRLDLPWKDMPLSLNHRRDRWKEHSINQQIQATVGWLARAQGLHHLKFRRVQLTLHWQPATRRDRDTDNTAPTVKALTDGLVKIGMIPDDTPQYVEHAETVFHPVVRKDPKVWLEIVPLEVP